METNFNKLINQFKKKIDSKYLKYKIVKFEHINTMLQNGQPLKIIQKEIETLFYEENVSKFNEELISKTNLIFKKYNEIILNHLNVEFSEEIQRFFKEDSKYFIGPKFIVDELIITIIINSILIYNQELVRGKLKIKGISVNNFIKLITNSLVNNYISKMYEYYSRQLGSGETKKIYSKYKEELLLETDLKNFYVLIHIVLISWEALNLAELILTKQKLFGKFHKVKTFKFKFDLVEPRFDLLSFCTKLPMVIKPIAWKSGEKSGGFLSNNLGLDAFYLSLRKTNNNVTIVDDPNFLNLINKLQEVSFCINKKMLEYIFLNFNYLISEQVIPHFKFITENVSVLYRDYSSNFLGALEEKLSYNQYYLKIYIPNFGKASRFYSNFLVAIAFCDFSDLFYVLNIDFRGRMYSQSNYINPQGSDFEKSLLSFKTISKLTSVSAINYWKYSGVLLDNPRNLVIFNDFIDYFSTNYSKFVSIAKGNVSFLKNNKSCFQFLSFCLEVVSNSFCTGGLVENQLKPEIETLMILSLDASQSSNQIGSALVLNKEVLFYTNILNKSDQKLDLYKYVASKILTRLEHYLMENTTNLALLREFNLNFLIINDRSFFKKVVMAAVNYGLTPYTFRNEIATNYPTFSKELVSLIVQETYGFLFDENGIFYKQYSFFKFLRKAITTRSSKYGISPIITINSFVNNRLVEQNKYNPVRINLFRRLCLDVFYMQGKNLLFRPYIKGKQYKFTIRHYVNEDLSILNKSNEDRHRIEQGFLANFIHSLDAEICYRVLEHFIDKGVPIRSNHDCFYLSPEYHAELRSVFQSVFYDIFKDPKVLFEKLLDDNGVFLGEEDQEYFDGFFEKSDVDLKDIFLSFWFLS